jgi:hypothetical protein
MLLIKYRALLTRNCTQWVEFMRLSYATAQMIEQQHTSFGACVVCVARVASQKDSDKEACARGESWE